MNKLMLLPLVLLLAKATQVLSVKAYTTLPNNPERLL